MAAYQNVIVAGASGNMGPAIVKALNTAKFTVSVLSREGSSHQFPPFVKVYKTDYSLPSLSEAFQGQDAVVSVVGALGILNQIQMIDAASKVGVRRFLPSSFGADLDDKEGMQPNFLGLMVNKLRVQEHLVKVCEENNTLTWTQLITGPILDWALLDAPVAMGFDIKAKAATIYDSGNAPVTCTPRPQIGIAVANSLKNPEATANGSLRMVSLEITQNKLLAALEQETGGEGWAVTRVSTKDSVASGLEKIAAKNFGGAFVNILAAQLYEDGTTRSRICTAEASDNTLLGVAVLDLDKYVADIVKQVSSK
ncbi:hypothetical protein VP1G_07466 [Cytospora mali]|uniref:NmrA-like domain-containing protein n=1 Tax=Cytospora mali TaxID=578113 RepID=A0A194V8N6_CYTMA|nr:hypothetical protein VP1G_07466 [Valsa mali var. pyri (nom. inval.)]